MFSAHQQRTQRILSSKIPNVQLSSSFELLCYRHKSTIITEWVFFFLNCSDKLLVLAVFFPDSADVEEGGGGGRNCDTEIASVVNMTLGF